MKIRFGLSFCPTFTAVDAGSGPYVELWVNKKCLLGDNETALIEERP